MNKISKIIRIITVAPVFALISVCLLYFLSDSVFINQSHLFVSILTLTILPLLAYPISLIKPKEERRKFQRNIAIFFSVAGYILGLVFSLVANSLNGEIVLYLTYLLSGLAIGFSTFILKKKSSGHACGISGPVALLSFYISPFFLFAILLLIPVYWASINMKRHTFSQLVSGTFIPIICLFISFLIIH